MTPIPRFWIGTNWKMNKTLAEATAFACALKAADADRDPRIQRFVVPPFTTVREVKTLLATSSVKVGAQQVLEEEVRGALGKLTGDQKKATILFAYEPVWAIGEKGIPASAAYADARQADILAVAEEILGCRPLCLYGGSVTPDNCEELIKRPNIDGLFIGRSAWQVEGYLDILAKCSKAID